MGKKGSVIGEADCKQPGLLVPVVDPHRCEAKGDCIRVCPTGVFALVAPTPDERRALGVLGRLRLFVHGGKQAVVASPASCEACGLCVPACPERAITLRAVTPPRPGDATAETVS